MSAYRPRHLAPPSGTSRRSLLRGSALGAMALSAGTAAAIAPAAQAAGLYGQDVSGWQGRVDWATQAAAGSRFAYVKATEGRSYRSPDFDHQYIGAGEAGLVRGGYHFARPDSGDPEEQVEFFVNNGGGWTSDGITLPGMVDFEAYSGLPRDYGLGQQEMREWISAFLVRYRDEVGRRPAVYTNANWWNDVVGDWAPTNTPLFLAAYQDDPPTKLPGRWWAYEIWQYSDAGPFAGDSNLWQGSEAQFEDFVSNADYSSIGI